MSKGREGSNRRPNSQLPKRANRKCRAKYQLIWLVSNGPEANILEQSIGMRESQDASVSVLWVGDGLEPKVGELCGNFSGALRGFGFNHESVRAPSHNGDAA
jgi:hypothetical protein